MSRRKCCCGCVYYDDLFNRNDTFIPDTDIGVNWVETSPESFIYYNMLQMSGSHAQAVYQQRMPHREMTVVATVKDIDPDVTYIVYGNMDASGYNFISLSYQEVHPNSGYIALYQSTNSTSFPPNGDWIVLEDLTFQYQEPGLTERQITICIDESLIRGEVTDNAMCRVMADRDVVIESGYYGGLGLGINLENTPVGYFDNFRITDKYFPNTACQPCIGCLCGSNTPPLKLIATYDGSGICDVLDGITVDLNHQRCGASEDIPWTGDVWNGGCLDGNTYEPMILKCSGDTNSEPYAWTLEVPILACAGANLIANPTVATCNPFMMEFDFNASSTNAVCPALCWPCGEEAGADGPDTVTIYKITVTERI